MIEPVKSFHDAVLAGIWPCRYMYHSHCSILRELYFQALGLAGFDHLPEAETYKGITGDLHGQLAKLGDVFAWLCEDFRLTVAECCLDQAIERVKEAYRSSKFQLQDWQKAHLERQRQKSRINADWEDPE